jgi:hypothetical protein
VYAEHHLRLSPTLKEPHGGYILEPPAVTWTTDNASVATVDSTGLVTGVAPGTSVITAAVGSVHASETVTVVDAPPSPSVDGDWTMTLSISPSCNDRFPLYAQNRKYSVHLTQRGGDFDLTIHAPTLQVANQGEDSGALFGPAISFGFIGDTDYGSYVWTDLHDYLSATETLDFSGSVTGTVSGSTIRGVMQGFVEYWVLPSATGPVVACRASDHVVTLER